MKLQRLQHKQTAKYELAIEIQGSWKIIEDSTGDLLYYLLKQLMKLSKIINLQLLTNQIIALYYPFDHWHTAILCCTKNMQ